MGRGGFQGAAHRMKYAVNAKSLPAFALLLLAVMLGTQMNILTL